MTQETGVANSQLKYNVLCSKSALTWAVIIGAFVSNITVSIPTYYGNLSTYTNSYFRFRLNQIISDAETASMLPVFLSCAFISLFTVDPFIGCIGQFAFLICAVVLFNVTMCLAYFSVQYSVILTIFVLMVLGGFASGSIMMANLKYATQVMPERVGLASAIVSSAFGLGGAGVNLFITAFINPDNLTPDVPGQNEVYFSQGRLLDNVPSVFIVIGVLSSVFQVIGCLLIQLPLHVLNREGAKRSPQLATHEISIDSSSGSSPSSSLELHSGKKIPPHDCMELERDYLKTIPTADRRETDHLKNIPPYDCIELETDYGQRIPPRDCRETDYLKKKMSPTRNDKVEEDNSRNRADKETEQPNFRPSEVLRTKTFYAVWLSFLVLTSSYVLVIEYYKIFGQLWIKDDDYLTTAGSVSCVTASVARLLLGILIDKAGYKHSLALIFALNSVLMAFWYLTPRFSWLYFVWFQIICGNVSMMFLMSPTAVLIYYGKSHYATNYGLVATSIMSMCILAPFFIPAILNSCGWFWLMALNSFVSIICLVIVVVVLP